MSLPSEISRPPFPEGKLRLWLDEFSDAARRYPDSLAVAVLQQPAMLYGVPNIPLDDEEYLARPHLRWSFASLESAILRLVDGLQGAGVKKGAVVFTFLLSNIEHLLVTYAAHTIGCVLVPVNPRSLKANTDEVKYQIETALAVAGQHGPRPVVFTETDDLAQEIDSMKPLLHDAIKIVVSPSPADKPRASCSAFVDLMYKSDSLSNGSNSLEKPRSPPSSPQKGSYKGKRRRRLVLRLVRSIPSVITCGLFRRPARPKEANSTPSADVASLTGQDYADDVILFTSGSTARPKAVWHKHPTFKAVFMHRRGQADNQSGPGSIFSCALPNNHALGYYWPQSFLAVGSAVVYPGGRFSAGGPSSQKVTSSVGNLFDPELVLRAMVRECVTHTTLVPTMVYALASTLAGCGGTAVENTLRPKHLVSVMMAGANCTPEVTRLCVEALGALGAENLYGMTEGIIISGGSHRDLRRIIDDEQTHVSVGSVVPGDAARIVDVETGAVVPRGAWGELHVSGPGLRRYVGAAGAEGNEAYYTDAGRLWYRSGDRGKMNEEGNIILEGRYKEMIIRGGENISPVAIESVLSKNPGLSSLQTIIVGAPDKLMGEVPVAVVKGQTVDPGSRQAVHDTILKHMGVMYLPDEVIAVGQLDGVSEVELTAAAGGKVPRRKITAAVVRFRAEQGKLNDLASEPEKDHDAELEAVLRDIWARTSGILPSKLPFDAPTGEFADSLTLIRVRDSIMRRTGRTLGVGDMVRAGSIAGQLKLLQSTPPRPELLAPVKLGADAKKAPPTVDDIEFLQADPALFATTKTIIENTIAPFGLEWNDVLSVFTSYDFADYMQDIGIMDSLQWRWFYTCKTANKDQLRKALEASLANNPLCMSFLIKTPALLDGNGVHVTMQPTSKMMDLIIHDGGTAATVAELSALCPNYPFPEKARLPGPTIHFSLYDIAETGAAGVVFDVQHMVQDGSYHWIVMEDLDTALLAITGGKAVPKLVPHVDYKLWADAYYTQRTSARARAITRWHVDRLRDLPRHGARAIPYLSQAHHYGSPDDGSSRHDEGAGLRVFAAPGLPRLRQAHPRISPPVVVHAALALLSVYITGYPHAMTLSFEAARGMLPFLPPALTAGWGSDSQIVKDATDVGGPTWHEAFYITDTAGTTMELLERMQEQQEAVTARAVVPLREVMTGLGLSMLDDGKGDADSACAKPPGLAQFMRGCLSLNWVPGLGAQVVAGDERFRCIQQVHGNIKPRGLYLVAGLAPDGQTVIFNLLGDAVDDMERGRLVERLEKIVLWMTAEENWKMPVSAFTSALES